MIAFLLALLFAAQVVHRHPMDEEINNLVVTPAGIQFTMKKATPEGNWEGRASGTYVVNVGAETMSYRGAKREFDDPGERDKVLRELSRYLGGLGALVEETCVLRSVRVELVEIMNEPPHEMYIAAEGRKMIAVSKEGEVACPNAQVRLAQDDWALVMRMNYGAFEYGAASYHWWWDAPLRRDKIVDHRPKN